MNSRWIKGLKDVRGKQERACRCTPDLRTLEAYYLLQATPGLCTFTLRSYHAAALWDIIQHPGSEGPHSHRGHTSAPRPFDGHNVHTNRMLRRPQPHVVDTTTQSTDATFSRLLAKVRSAWSPRTPSRLQWRVLHVLQGV